MGGQTGLNLAKALSEVRAGGLLQRAWPRPQGRGLRAGWLGDQTS